MSSNSIEWWQINNYSFTVYPFRMILKSFHLRILSHSRSQNDADTQSTHIPLFNVTSISGSEVSSVKQFHLHVSIPSAFQPYYDCLWMYSKSTLFKDRQKSTLILLFNTVQLPATNTMNTLDTEFIEEENEVALILMNMPLHSARC